MNKAEQKLCFILGLAQKAGKITSGDYAVKAMLKQERIKTLILAADASEKVKKELVLLTKQYQIKIITGPSRAELGAAIGKSPRSAVAVLDQNFANMADNLQ